MLRESRARDAELDALLLNIAAVPATTPDGASAKARLMLRWMHDGWDFHLAPPLRPNPYEACCVSLARDLMAGSVAA